MKKVNFLLAATNVVHHTTADKQKVAWKGHGTGTIVDADALATDTTKYPIGSIYINISGAAGSVMYVRKAAAGVAADWVNVNA